MTPNEGGAVLVEALVKARFGEAGATDPRVDTPTVRSLLSRASCRSFTDEPVPEALLHPLLAAALSAPSKSDLQQASVVVVADAELRRAALSLSPENAWAFAAPVLLVWLADGRRFPRAAALRNHVFANDHLDAFFNATVDAAIALSAFIVAAESVGLGCCPLSEIRDRAGDLARLLRLPERVVPVAGLCAGWPKEARKIKARLPLSVTVHRDRYDDSGLESAIEGYDARRARDEPRPPEAQRDVEVFGIADVYGWSEDRGRQYARPMRADFGAFVRSQGFDLS